MDWWLFSAIVAAIICITFTLGAVFVDNRYQRQINEAKAAGGDIPPSSTPLLAGLAIVALAVVFFSVNRIDRSMKPHPFDSATCGHVIAESPRQAAAGDTIRLTITATIACTTLTGDVNGSKEPLNISADPVPSGTAGAAYSSWILNAPHGKATVRLWDSTGASPHRGATFDIDVKQYASTSDIASWFQTTLTSITAIIGVLVTLLGLFKRAGLT